MKDLNKLAKSFIKVNNSIKPESSIPIGNMVYLKLETENSQENQSEQSSVCCSVEIVKSVRLNPSIEVLHFQKEKKMNPEKESLNFQVTPERRNPGESKRCNALLEKSLNEIKQAKNSRPDLRSKIL